MLHIPDQHIERISHSGDPVAGLYADRFHDPGSLHGRGMNDGRERAKYKLYSMRIQTLSQKKARLYIMVVADVVLQLGRQDTHNTGHISCTSKQHAVR